MSKDRCRLADSGLFVYFQFIYNVFTQNVYIEVVYCRQKLA